MENISSINRFKNIIIILYIVVLIGGWIISLFPHGTIILLIDVIVENEGFAEKWVTLDLGDDFSVIYKRYIPWVWGGVLLLSLPGLILTIASIYKKFIRKDFFKKLYHIKLNYKSKDRSRNFLGKIYIQRAVTPKIELAKDSHNWDDNYLILTRSHDEMKNIADTTLIGEQFKLLQKSDYSKYFDKLEKSYYVTSVHDKDVWVINRRNDINYYSLNYKTHIKIKNRKNSNSTGIHRGFILDNNICYKNHIKPNIGLFINTLKSIYESYIRERDKLFYNPLLLELGKKFGFVVDSDGHINLNEEKFVFDPKVQFLFTIFAAKIHEKLEIDFSVFTFDAILQHNKNEEYKKYIRDWNDWDLLGCAMFDEIMVTHVYQDKAKSSIKYAFNFNLQNGMVNSFKEFLSNPDFKMFEFFVSNQNYDDIMDDFIKNEEFDKICNNYAELIKYESKPWFNIVFSKKPELQEN